MLIKNKPAQVRAFLRTVSERYDDEVAQAAREAIEQFEGSQFDPDEILDDALRARQAARVARDREFAMGRCDSH